MIAVTSHDGYITPEEYLELERQSEIKHEYIDGQIYAMAGTTKAHNAISINLAMLFREKLRNSTCQTFMADVKVNVTEKKGVFYPDLVVTCNDDEDMNSYEVKFPKLIVEVLSPSTEQFDRGKKFRYYRTIPSLQEYILVGCQEYLVEVFRRMENNLWILQTYEGLEAIARVESLAIDTPLSEIYGTLDFTKTEPKEEGSDPDR
ncbi:Uma2 family endonuclease [Oxynema aestuarii]|jgi:Uma2 family endonuclease|uniref:Uma2 family endonuclease n=1 Tax=Oxynema aestuarii AP17 TaxID=2064643 RepID=A0A6H1U3F9_9CYAN|nr:Uma2 family endonuclease [Oxynema aestuarii]QIZ73374.1 Uma2 family endonuclease [Oxynema aestuarii AP17]